MVKRIGNNRRFAEVRPQKVAKGHFKKNVMSKRRQNHFSQGKGTTGVCLRVPRVKRVFRIIANTQMKHLAAITGKKLTEADKVVFFETFYPTMIGSLDKYCNVLVKFIYSASTLNNNRVAGKVGGGIKLTRDKLEFGKDWIHKLSSKEK